MPRPKVQEVAVSYEQWCAHRRAHKERKRAARDAKIELENAECEACIAFMWIVFAISGATMVFAHYVNATRVFQFTRAVCMLLSLPLVSHLLVKMGCNF